MSEELEKIVGELLGRMDKLEKEQRNLKKRMMLIHRSEQQIDLLIREEKS